MPAVMVVHLGLWGWVRTNASGTSNPKILQPYSSMLGLNPKPSTLTNVATYNMGGSFSHDCRSAGHSSLRVLVPGSSF